MLTVLIDYQSGNLHSAAKGLARVADENNLGQVIVSADPADIARADRLVLPGDGAFPACRAALQAVPGLEEALFESVQTKGRPFLGICIGMQMLASEGLEYTPTPGFGWVPGQVRPIQPTDPSLKVPHMGWNDLVVTATHPVLDGINTGDHVYFVHSYHVQVTDPAHRLAYADYGAPITAIIGHDNVIGAQFHPEKSQATGLRFLANFLRWAP